MSNLEEGYFLSKILVIGMSRSSHLQKWLSIMPNKWSEIHFVESTQDLVDKTRLTSAIPIQFIETRYDLLSKYFIPFWIFNKILSRFSSSLKFTISSNQASFRISKALRDNEYDAIHCFEIQHAGYALLQVLDENKNSVKSKIFVSCWGSDIYWFINQEKHKRKISRLLQSTNVLILDTDRDIALSRSLGYLGAVFRINSHAGGLDLNEIVSDPYIDINDRDSIIIKGHFGFVGRPFFSIDVLLELAPLIKKMDLELNVISCPPAIIPMIKQQIDNYGLRYRIHKPYELSRFELIKLYRRSKLCIANSMSDGIPTTAIESMANGCVPIQSNTSSLSEWGVDERIVLSPIDGISWFNIIKHLLENEFELKKIAKFNLRIVKDNFSVNVVQKQINQIYDLL